MLELTLTGSPLLFVRHVERAVVESSNGQNMVTLSQFEASKQLFTKVFLVNPISLTHCPNHLVKFRNFMMFPYENNQLDWVKRPL